MAWIDDLNSWITSHTVLVASLGVPVLTLVVTAIVSWLTTRASSKAQDRQRNLLHQLKLADFRQAWINDMRQDFALYTARTWNTELNSGKEAQKEQVMAQARILMRMNPSDPDYELLIGSLKDPSARPSESQKALFEIGQRILKREWERLKEDLEETQRR